MPVMIGADPEFFVKRNGHWISAHNVPLGTKKNPKETRYGFVQNDGMAVECNVRPADNVKEFLSNTFGVITDLRKLVRDWDHTADIYAKPYVMFGKTTFEQTPAEAKQLGCEPDFNAYTKTVNPRPTVTDKIMFRTGAGHIHIGWTKNQNPRTVAHMVKCFRLVKELDYRIGLPSLRWDRDPHRRILYGKAGSFRPKPYGLEYRVPSNVFFTDPKLVAFVFNQAQQACTSVFDKKEELEQRYGDCAQQCINTSSMKWQMDFPLLFDQLDYNRDHNVFF